MLNPQNIYLVIGISCLVLAWCVSIIDGIWDSIEDDVAKKEGYDKIKK